jgi:predicted PolB exonuclease-like 3'-5' exonuclease
MNTPLIPTAKTNLLLIDIETVGATKDLPTLKAQNPALAEAFEGYRDWFDKRFPEEKLGSNDELFLNKAALVSEFLQVISVTVGWFDNAGGVSVKNVTSCNEKELLTEVKDLMNRAYSKGMWLCGHNVKSFDLPVLSKRFVANGLLPSEFCARMGAKPWDLKVVDTKELWQFTNSYSLSSLDLMCATLGVESPKKGKVKGNNLHEFFYKASPPADKTLTAIGNYCNDDVKAVGSLITKLYELS